MTDTQLQTNSTFKVFAARTTDEIMDVMRQEDTDAEREKILRSMTPACLDKLKYFDNWLRKDVEQSLRSRYELGIMALELFEDEKKKNSGKLYGRNAIGRICKVLRWDDGVIRVALHFVQTYSREDLEYLCDLVLPSGAPLTWSHVRCLLPVKDANRRQVLLDRTVAEGWSCFQLARAMKDLEDGRESDGRGRPPTMPKDFDGVVAQQQEFTERWERMHSKVWGQADRSLVGQATKLAPDEVTEQRLRKASELAHQMRRMADQAVEQAEKAEQIVRDFEHILKLRQQVGAEGARTQ